MGELCVTYDFYDFDVYLNYLERVVFYVMGNTEGQILLINCIVAKRTPLQDRRLQHNVKRWSLGG